MWEWLTLNKQWVFSGIGVAVLGAIWWILRKIGARREPVTSNRTVTQSPISTVTQSPTININVPQAQAPVTQPPKQEPPATSPPPVARANLKVEATKLGKV
jgi:hypothetical protein